MLELDRISLSYATDGCRCAVLRDLSLSLEAGQIACLLGASGCGKTSVLRAIAGFEPLDGGSIRLDGRLLSGEGVRIEPEHRRVGMMFQDYALFPHLDVAANVGFGLRRLDAAERNRRVRALLNLVGLTGQEARRPHELSGGQQQRVALARALAPEPELLLLDEPFSNLDVDARERLAFELRDLLKAAGRTALVVTHNQAEAFAVADRIGILREGRLAQWDTPYGMHHHPATPEIAAFIHREALMARRAQANLRGAPDSVAA
ncbi:ABC transporter ATP-binding protein [Castellaniella ginsengisoli]|uniref:ABC transporter ATP-binding protein n=1 Tax=Castellaniella ginsengisoli TaxID=546114 RepID=A0AB39CUE7_9BURK